MKPVSSGEDALLWLLNSSPIVRGVPHDYLMDQPLAETPLVAMFSTGESVESPARLVELRTLLQQIGYGHRPHSDLAGYLDGVALHPRLEGATVTWMLVGPSEQLPLARIVLEWLRIGQERPGRLRPCANPECTKFLIDHSRPNSAKWCSMAECGNRLKARRHAARSADAS